MEISYEQIEQTIEKLDRLETMFKRGILTSGDYYNQKYIVLYQFNQKIIEQSQEQNIN